MSFFSRIWPSTGCTCDLKSCLPAKESRLYMFNPKKTRVLSAEGETTLRLLTWVLTWGLLWWRRQAKVPILSDLIREDRFQHTNICCGKQLSGILAIPYLDQVRRTGMVLGRPKRAGEANMACFPCLDDFLHPLPTRIEDECKQTALRRVHPLSLTAVCAAGVTWLTSWPLLLTLPSTAWPQQRSVQHQRVAHLLWACITWVESRLWQHTANMRFLGILFFISVSL